MTKSVFPIPARSSASTAAGSVLSRTVREVAPKLAASTWGARLEPPMPHTIARVSPSLRTAAAGLVGAVGAGGAGRFLASRRAARRSAKAPEQEVSTQTRSLVDSLAATAAAARPLRLGMDAVPEAIAVLDRDGSVIDLNESA